MRWVLNRSLHVSEDPRERERREREQRRRQRAAGEVPDEGERRDKDSAKELEVKSAVKSCWSLLWHIIAKHYKAIWHLNLLFFSKLLLIFIIAYIIYCFLSPANAKYLKFCLLLMLSTCIHGTVYDHRRSKPNISEWWRKRSVSVVWTTENLSLIGMQAMTRQLITIQCKSGLLPTSYRVDYKGSNCWFQI